MHDSGQQMIKQKMQYSKIQDTNNEPQKAAKGSFIRLLGYTYKHKLLLIMGNISLIVTSLSMVAIPYLTGQMIDAITKEDGKSELNTLTFEFIAVTIITALFTLIRASAYNILGEKVTIDLRNELFAKLIRKDIEFFDQNRSGELVSRLTSDISLIQSGASDVISIMLRNLIQFFGSLILLWAISWKLTAVLLGVIPPFAFMVVVFIRYYKQYSKEYQAIAAESTQLATEVLGNMRVVRSFSTEDKEQQAFEKATAKAYIVGVKRAILGGLFASIGMALGYGVILGILYYGGSLVLSGDLTVGELSSFVLYTLTMTVSLISVSGMLNIMVQSAAVSEKIFSLIDTPISITDGVLAQKLEGNITIQNMSFHYPSKEQVQVLKDLSLEIRSGEVIAFVGQSGSGKSTIVALLERFYECTSGQVLLDNTDVRLFELKRLHRQIGYVAQEPTLFSGSLRDNITYGVDLATEEEIEQAMKLANAYDFVTNKQVFPEGLDTIVGERGVKLSGGQKQRIAIARALIKNPKILIFDEATSALDSESEYQVQKAIDGLVQSGQKTIILIAHRLSTIINADKIVVIQNGLIAEIGRHEELIAQNGVYKALIERQLS